MDYHHIIKHVARKDNLLRKNILYQSKVIIVIFQPRRAAFRAKLFNKFFVFFLRRKIKYPIDKVKNRKLIAHFSGNIKISHIIFRYALLEIASRSFDERFLIRGFGFVARGEKKTEIKPQISGIMFNR